MNDREKAETDTPDLGRPQTPQHGAEGDERRRRQPRQERWRTASTNTEAAPRPRPDAVTGKAGERESTPLPSVQELVQEMLEAAGEERASDPSKPTNDPPTVLHTIESTLREAVMTLRGTGRSVPRGPVTAAWLRTALLQTARTQSTGDGWKVLELQLDNGDGTMTIKARQEAERVAVTVGFSDPHLRALALEHADRLQEALRQQYDAAVDLSLTGDETGNAPQQDQPGRGRRAGSAPLLEDSPDTPAEAAAPRAGARHVWVG